MNSPNVQRTFDKYLKPENDKILSIQRDIEETKIQLKRDIEYGSLMQALCLTPQASPRPR